MGRGFVTILFFLLLLSLPLGAAVWRSNALFQELEHKEALEGKGWEAEEKDGVATLYLDGFVMGSKRVEADGWSETRGGEERRYILQDGILVRKRVKSEGHVEEYNYYYNGLILESVKKSLDGVIVSTTVYLVTSDGTLLGYFRDGDEAYWNGDRYVSVSEGTAEELLLSVWEEKERTTVREKSEDGGEVETVTGEDGTVTRWYDGNGRLVKEEKESSLVLWSYSEDGVLLEKMERDGGGSTVTLYSGGAEAEVSRYGADGTIETRSVINSDGEREETRYISGVARYLFIYDRDGKRIKEARGL